ncbi:hypothetical protein PVAND_012785 [Polypedilum vanderplanki]|uniref:Odorant receptor n=1 Tax=Polypedilum vanderplanki TaxID=319348 RepID=A0A9J6CNR5_POLVA|nr:hypothetical protein PVAND_012785 [Polypedilum vanderplanki]
MYNYLIKIRLLFFGFDIDGNLQNFPRLLRFLKFWKYIVTILLFLGILQVFTFIIFHDPSDFQYLLTVFVAILSIESITKWILMNLNWNRMELLYKNIIEFHDINYGKINSKNERILKIISRFITIYFVFDISANLFEYVTILLQIYSDFVNQTYTEIKFSFGLYWPFNSENHRLIILFYMFSLPLLFAAIVLMIDQFMIFTIAYLAICFDRLGDEMIEIIDGSEYRAFRDTKKMLAKCVDKHNQLIVLCDEMNLIYGANSIVYFVPTSFLMCLLGFAMIKKKDSSAAAGAFGMFAMLTQAFVMFYASDKLKENSMSIANKIANSEFDKIDRLLKKNFLLMIQMAHRPRVLNAFGLLLFDLTLYASVVNSAYSYLAILKHFYS